METVFLHTISATEGMIVETDRMNTQTVAQSARKEVSLHVSVVNVSQVVTNATEGMTAVTVPMSQATASPETVWITSNAPMVVALHRTRSVTDGMTVETTPMNSQTVHRFVLSGNFPA